MDEKKLDVSMRLAEMIVTRAYGGTKEAYTAGEYNYRAGAQDAAYEILTNLDKYRKMFEDATTQS